MIVKRDQSRERFDRKKVFTGLLKACEKRPVPMKGLEDIIQEIETTVQSSLEREISSAYIGELCMKFLRNLDEIAYIRFASVYKEFKDLNEFMHELKNFINEKETF